MEKNKINLNEMKRFWKGKKIFLTGHTGFKGSWMCILLSILGARVIGYSLYPKKKELFDLGNLKKLNYKNIYEDILDYKSLYTAIKTNKPNVIIHMAAQSLVGYSYNNPDITFNTNSFGTMNILSAVRKVKSVKSTIIVTTDKVYKINGKKKYNEFDELGGHDPYSSSKVCAEIITSSFIKSYFEKDNVQISTARSGNVIGGGDFSKDRLVVDILSSINKKKKLILRMPYAIRPWQHVIEPLIGYLKLVEFQFKNNDHKLGNSWNFGPNESSFQPVQKIVQLFKKKYKFDVNILKKKRYYETNILKLDNQKAKRHLNWYPKWNFNKTVNKIIEWESEKKKIGIRNICEKQILSYLLNK